MRIVPAHCAPVGLVLMLTVGAVFTVIVDAAVAVQVPVPATTVYVVLLAGLTVIVAVVAPVFQEKGAVPTAVSVVLLPKQIDGAPTVIFTLGAAIVVAVTLAVPVQPPASATVTEYVPAVLTLMVDVLLPCDHV